MTNRISAKDLAEKDDPLVMVAVYDAPSASIADEVADVLLVGDSVGNTRLGYDDTIPVTLEQSLSHTGAVARASEDAMVVGDMPFGSFGASLEDSSKNATRYLKEGGANGVKIETPVEGGVSVETVGRMTQVGVPVMGHVGLTPQQINRKGYRVQGRDDEEADAIVERARELEDAGAFSVVLESVPESVGERVTEALEVPTIGIGAGREVDGQVLVFDDLVGMGEETLSFVKEYGDVRAEMRDATEEFAKEVRNGEFPSDEHAFEG